MAQSKDFDQAAAVVCGLSPAGEICIRLLAPGGPANDEAESMFPPEMLPADLRTTGTPLWASVAAQTGEILWLWGRHEIDEESLAAAAHSESAASLTLARTLEPAQST